MSVAYWDGSQWVGLEGDSAYEVAVANGFQGDAGTWLANLAGPPGPIGPQGPQGEKGEPGGDPDALLWNLRILHGSIETGVVSDGHAHRVTFPADYFKPVEEIGIITVMFSWYADQVGIATLDGNGVGPAGFTAKLWSRAAGGQIIGRVNWIATQGAPFIRAVGGEVVKPPPPPPAALTPKSFTTSTSQNLWKSWAQVSGAGTGQPFWDANTTKLYYGRYDGTNGQQASAMQFTGASRLGLKSINAANVTGGSLHFYNAHTFGNAGGTVRVHLVDNPPYPFGSTVAPYSAAYIDVPVPKAGAVGVELPLDWCKYLTNGGNAAGLLFAGTGSGQASYGFADARSVYVTVRYNG